MVPKSQLGWLNFHSLTLKSLFRNRVTFAFNKLNGDFFRC